QWGSSQTQDAPQVSVRVASEVYNKDTKKIERVFDDRIVPLRSSRIDVKLDLEQRRKGLLWYNLYDVTFVSHYVIRNDTTYGELSLHFPFPSANGSYRNFQCLIGGKPVPGGASALSQGNLRFTLAPGQQTTIDLRYLSGGMNAWAYRFGSGVQSINDFTLTMTTNFDAIDFPPQTLLPVREASVGNAWHLKWQYASLVTGNAIGMAFPTPLQPGPLAQRITFWAPVALLFYLFVMLIITTLRNIDLHPVNYFFLAAAFFAFHLLFAYLVDRIALEVAFVICSLVSMFLTVSYLRIVVGLRFAAVESGLAQLVYLVLFSYALFNEGWSGLAITVGIIVTLFAVMQLTGRIKWSERFG
ncbi:MAG: inner membrane CreD family protein, partial [Candidatus Eremiobacteraeota bacterium]|nr:inner membrane CreD family protein [Candidatus Eremiobacteraeota bacterium]